LSRRLLVGIASLIGVVLMAPVALSTSLMLQMYPLTGELRLLNSTNTPIPIIFYEIRSPSGGLNGASGVWTSISDTYDKPPGGNGFIDSANDWNEISATPFDLTEGTVHDPGGMLPAFRSIGLGRIWNPNVATAASIVPTFLQSPGQSPMTFDKTLVVDGDYSTNLSVGPEDYSPWSILFGSSSFPLADGNHNGIVDAADYTVWRDNLGAHYVPGLGEAGGGGALSAAAVPEPTGVLLALVGSSGAFGGWLLRRRNL
jgi:hypothetical protein